MRNVRPAFEVWEKDVENIPPGYQQIKCHMIFDVKMGENFRHKARFVTGGHTTKTPMSLTYSSVVSRDSVRIILLTVALNGLQVMACDIQNAYLTANCHEKIWTYAGPEFGSEHGQPMIIKKALYGLKSSGMAFRAHLAETLHDIGFKPTKADPDVWICPVVKLDGSKYYEYIMCYIDNILSVSLDAKSILQSLQRQLKLKGNKIEPPGYVFGHTNGDNTGRRQRWMVHVFREIHKICYTEHRRNTTKDGATTPIQMQDTIGLWVLSGTGCHSRVEG